MTKGARDDVLYPTSFYAYQTPVLLDYVAVLNGVPPPVPDGAPFTYLDLGCGDGFTVILLAAIHAESHFIGIDISAGHIAFGRRLAEAAGIHNVELIEGDFEKWRGLDLPACDYIALHGVYAWVGDIGRAAICEIAKERLKPGGLLYCGYNALPGWAAIAPLRHYFEQYTRGMGPDVAANVAATLRHLLEMKSKGAEFLLRNPVAANFLDDMSKLDVRYVVHEIFPPEWSPLAFSTVLSQMRSVGLDFLGSADLVKNSRRLAVKPELLPVFLKEPRFEHAELYRDYANNTFHRRDVFHRPRPDETRRPFEELAVRPFGAKVPIGDLQSTLVLPWGRIALEADRFGTLRQALVGGTRTLDEIVAEPALARLPQREIVEALQGLTFGMEIAPFLRAARTPTDPPKDWSVPLPLNRLLLHDPLGPEPFAFLASNVAGTAAILTRNEAQILLAVAEAGRAGAADWSWRFASERQRWLSWKGVAATERTKHLAAFNETLQALGARLAKWVELGLIVPR